MCQMTWSCSVRICPPEVLSYHRSWQRGFPYKIFKLAHTAAQHPSVLAFPLPSPPFSPGTILPGKQQSCAGSKHSVLPRARTGAVGSTVTGRVLQCKIRMSITHTITYWQLPIWYHLYFLLRIKVPKCFVGINFTVQSRRCLTQVQGGSDHQ